MALSKRSVYAKEANDRYRQGDLLRGVSVIEWAEIVEGELIVQERPLPYAIILSQECDLEHDYNNRADTEKCKSNTDKFLQTLLLCPAYPAEQVRSGSHLTEIGQFMQKLSTDQWKRAKQNNEYRYHFLAEDQDLQVPDLILDFKHYFTIPTLVAYRPSVKATYLASLDDLFREHLSARFAHYLCRVGLPELETS